MSFRSELKSVKSKLASGGFKQAADNPLIGFADQIAYGITKRDEEKRQEERIKRQEARVEARRVRAAQVAEEKKAREREKLANLYLTANAQSKTPENKAAVMSLITDGGITNLSDLETMMSSYTTYTEGTPKADIDTQMSQAMEGVSTFQTGNAIDDSQLNSMEKDASNLSSDGTISFTGKKPADISEFFSGIEDKEDWDAKGSEISAMPEGVDKARYMSAWQTIGKEKRFEAKVSDDPFKDPDGNFLSQSEIEVIARDSDDPEIQARGKRLTTDALDPVTMQREDLVAKIAIMEASNAKADESSPVFTEEDMAPFKTALESKNSLKTEDSKSSEKLGNAEEIAKLAYIEANGVMNMSPADQLEAMKKFKREWATETAKVEEQSETYTTANYTSDLIKFSQMLASTDQAQVEKATKWFTTTKPLIEATMLNIANMSEEGRIKLLEDAGVPRDKATSIALGLIKTTNDGFGNPMLVDISTGAGSGVNDAPQNTGEPDADLESQASISDTGALIFKNEDGSTEELLSAEDLKLAQAELGIQGRIDSLDDVTAAFGPSGFFGKITNTALGPVTSENPAKEAGAAMSAIKSLNVITTLQMVTMFPNIRDSVALKAQLNELLPKVGKFWYSDAKALEDFANAQGVLQTAIKTNDDIVNDRVGITNVSKSKAQAALLALEPLEKVYATIVDQMKKQGIGGGTSTSEESLNQSIFVQPDKSQSKNQEASNLEPEIGIVGALPNLTPELATGVLAGIKNGKYSAQAARNSFYKKFSKGSVDRIIPLN